MLLFVHFNVLGYSMIQTGRDCPITVPAAFQIFFGCGRWENLHVSNLQYFCDSPRSYLIYTNQYKYTSMPHIFKWMGCSMLPVCRDCLSTVSATFLIHSFGVYIGRIYSF